jgi:hypothetical protein
MHRRHETAKYIRFDPLGWQVAVKVPDQGQAVD